LNLINLSEVCEQIRGVSYKEGHATGVPSSNHTKLYRANNISNGTINENKLVFVSNEIIKEKQFLREGDILIAASSGSVNLVGKAAMIKENTNVTFGAFCKVLRPNEKIDMNYFSHFFQSDNYFRYIRRVAAGSNINNLKNEHFDNLKIPLPSLEEQKRIAKILDKAQELINQKNQVINKIDILEKSLFNSFSKKEPLVTRKVKDIVLEIESGWSVGGEEREKLEDELGVLKISAVTSGRFNSKKYKVVDKEEINKQLLYPQKGDILFSRANTKELVGAICIVDEDYKDLFLPDKLWKISIDETLCQKYFFVNCVASRAFHHEIEKRATGTSGSMVNISKAKFLDINIQLPRIEVQEEFDCLMERLELERKKHINSLENSKNLYQSLLQRAFKGELTKEKVG